MDYPLKAESQQLLKIAKNCGDGGEDFLRAMLLRSESHHDFAACFLALWDLLGYYPITTTDYPSNRFIEQSVGLACAIYDERLKVSKVPIETSKRSECYESIQHRLTTSVQGINGGYIMPMSDMARRQAQLLREEQGYTHIGARMVDRPKFKGWLRTHGFNTNVAQI
jgi:hypothetical protein